MSEPGVSFVVPVYNGARFIERVLDSIVAQADGRPMEILVIDDRSTDGSRAIIERYAAAGQITVLDGKGQGAAAAINQGVRVAQHDLIAQVDHDVILEPGWLTMLARAIEPPDVAAAQGYYATNARASAWARVMGYDLEARYQRLDGDRVNHACTGTTLYRKRALFEIGLFDEHFGYGYDNDLSYRLTVAGFRLLLCREARSTHLWRERAAAYLRQQYGIGYGRLDIVSKHGSHYYGGDDAAGPMMVLHAPIMMLALGALSAALLMWVCGITNAHWPAMFAGGLLGALAVERSMVGVRAARHFRDPVCLLFPVAHLLRDLAWCGALIAWTLRRVSRQPRVPDHSMPRSWR